MRYAVVSDVHGNLEALSAVLADAAGRADSVVCLGDVVGYGADPVACAELIAERADVVVAGNHEHGVAGLLDLEWFNRYARAAMEWTREQMDDDHRAWLATRPLRAEIEEATLVHASPASPEEWDYLITPDDGFEAFPAFTTRLCFVGHSHRPGTWSIGSTGPDHQTGSVDIQLEPGRRYIVNVGSVGQPRDGDPRAAYAVCDLVARRITIRRVPYDVQAARTKILAAGLPRFLSDRLSVAS